jgi:hypothetical protein
VTHAYSEDRDQEGHLLKPAQANSLQDPISKKPFTKRAVGVAQGVGPEFKPQSTKKKKKNLWLKTIVMKQHGGTRLLSQATQEAETGRSAEPLSSRAD